MTRALAEEPASVSIVPELRAMLAAGKSEKAVRERALAAYGAAGFPSMACRLRARVALAVARDADITKEGPSVAKKDKAPKAAKPAKGGKAKTPAPEPAKPSKAKKAEPAPAKFKAAKRKDEVPPKKAPPAKGKKAAKASSEEE